MDNIYHLDIDYHLRDIFDPAGGKRLARGTWGFSSPQAKEGDMRIRAARSVALFGILLLTPFLTRAQGSHSARWEFFVAGGASTITDKRSSLTQFVGINNQFAFITSDFKTHVHPAGRLLTGIRYWFNPRDGFEASYSYAPSNISGTIVNTLTFVPSMITTTAIQLFDASVRAHYYSFNYVRRFRPRSRWRPHLTAGIGGIHWEPSFGPLFLHKFENSFTGNFGVGMDWTLSSHWALQAEYRDFLIEHPRASSEGAPTGLSHAQSPTVGLVFRF
jgi:opacity protein-like surface antigen